MGGMEKGEIVNIVEYGFVPQTGLIRIRIIIIIIIKDQTGHPRKSPRTIRLRRVPRGQSKIIRKARRKNIYKLD